MANNNGLTSTGFVRPTLEELIQNRKQKYREVLGANINTAEDSYLDKFASIHAKAEYDLWEMGAGVYYNQTYQGAEGIYLDDVFGRRGIYRKGKTKSNGSILIQVNNTVPYNTIFKTTDYKINTTYVLQRDIQVAGSIYVHSIKNADLVLGNYVFTIYNTSSQTTQTLNLTLSSKTPNSAPLNTFFNSIKTFIVNNTTSSNTSKIFIDNVAGDLYIGQTSSTVITGLTNPVDLRVTPIIGNRYIYGDVVNTEFGFNPLDVGGINSIDPQPSGFVSISNITAFFSGSEVESDGEYRARASLVMNTAQAATRSAIINGLLTGVKGVTKVKIFNNPTNTTSPSGIPPYKFNTVIYGGETIEISKKLYSLIACSNNTFGEVSYVVTTEDEQPETIYHTKAQERPISIRVNYKTASGAVLSDTEQQEIIKSLNTQIGTYNINPTIYNIQLLGAVQRATPFVGFIQLSVETKEQAGSPTSYNTSDITTTQKQVITLIESEIFFNRIV